MIFDIVEYIIIEWTMPNESRMCRKCRRVLNQKKRRVLLSRFPRSSTGQKHIFGPEKLNREDYGVDKYLCTHNLVCLVFGSNTTFQ